ncbi:MAG: magnesium and cobalt transport protein CorA [Tannerellaceae bacterium]|nr:magnesium and cobalt transport protein CorA [Tannerellaceae bacterium]
MNHKSKSSVKNNRHFSKRYYYTGHYRNSTRIRLTRYNATLLETVSVDPATESFTALLTDNCIHWFEVQGLTDDVNIARMFTEFGMHSLDAREVLTPAHVVKIDVNEDYVMVVLNSCFITADRKVRSDHVSLLIKPTIVISFNEGHAPLFENVYQALQTDTMNIRRQKSGLLFAFLFNAIMADLIESSTQVENQLERIEDQLLGRNYNQKNIGARIQQCRHAYLILRKNSTPLREQFHKLTNPIDGILEKHVVPVFKDLQDQLEYVIQTMRNCNDILSSLVDLYVSNNDFKMNGIMKRLTIVSTIFAPITFLVGVWGMNFEFMPELKWRYGYLMAWGILILISGLVWRYMKKRDWF